MATKTMNVKEDTNKTNITPKRDSFDKNAAVEYFIKQADYLAEKATKGELTSEEETIQSILKYAIMNKDKTSNSEMLSVFKDVKEFFEPTKKPDKTLKKPGLKKPKDTSEDAPDTNNKVVESAKDTDNMTKEKSAESKTTSAMPVLKKNNEVQTIAGTTSKGADSLPIAIMFPKELNIKDRGIFRAAYDKYTTYEEVITALEQGKTLYFMCFWTLRQLKEFDYAGHKLVKSPQKGFENNLDIVEMVIPCATIKRLWGISLYTEGLYRFEADDFAYIEDTDPRNEKNKFRVRLSAGLEFEIYEPVEEIEK